MTLTIPPQIHMDGLLPFLARLSTVGDAEEIRLDFSGLRRVSPGALVALVATVTRWLRQRRKVAFLNLDRCAITGYLQRMDVLKCCGAGAQGGRFQP
jgi:anti-anti-sigma regulatory factor